MTDTNFSIQLQGLNLPEEAATRLQSELRTVVMSEIAKIDLAGEVSIEPLPEGKGFPDFRPILGILIRNGGLLPAQARATTGLTDKNAIMLPRTSEVTMPPPGPGPTRLLDGASFADVLSEVYYRPDIRAAIVSNTRAFAQLLSHDEAATQVFNQLTSGSADATSTTQADGTEKLAPVVIGLIIAGAFVAGGVVGYISRPK